MFPASQTAPDRSLLERSLLGRWRALEVTALAEVARARTASRAPTWLTDPGAAPP